MKIKLFVLIFLFFTSNFASADTTVAGKITQVKMFSLPGGLGGFAIYMNELAPACGSSDPRRVLIKSDHPIFSTVVASALAAKMANSDIEIVHSGTCTVLDHAWDFVMLLVK